MATPEQDRFLVDVLGLPAALVAGSPHDPGHAQATPPAGSHTPAEQAARERLMAAQHAAIEKPAFQPRDHVTHCNQATLSVAEATGLNTQPLTDTHGSALLANAMHHNLDAAHSGYHKIKADEAQRRADQGQTVLVTGRGHIAEVAPDDIPGQSLPGSGPVIGNVGATNRVERLSRVFRKSDQPGVEYFVQDDPTTSPHGPTP